MHPVVKRHYVCIAQPGHERIRARTFANSRGTPAIFFGARRKRNRVVETRGIRRHYKFPGTLGHFGSLSLASFLLLKRRRESQNGKRERKLIANATGTKLPNRLSPDGTGPLISRAGASKRRTLFLRGGDRANNGDYGTV